MSRACNRCVMDDTSDESITFDKNGHCSYCTDALSRMPREYFPGDVGRAKLDAMMAKIKQEGKTKDFDCMVGVSGGADSSYVLYLGYRYGLRMLSVHIDDGLDTDIAKKNIEALVRATGVALVSIRPNMDEYRDLTLSLFRASVPNLALAQDNVILAALDSTARKYGVKYLLSGSNFALESILQRDSDSVDNRDGSYIRAIHRRHGTGSIGHIPLLSLSRGLLLRRSAQVQTLRPLNHLEHNLRHSLEELGSFCGYTYYGGKHHESVLSRFLQCYYLPVKYGLDKRKSHFSSMIVSGQMSREEALERLSHDPYPSDELRQSDFEFLAGYLGQSRGDFEALIGAPPRRHSDYPRSSLYALASAARKVRDYVRGL